MAKIKEFLGNLKNYSEAEISKFIYDFTDNFKPFLLIKLNKEFVNFFAKEIDSVNYYGEKKNNVLLKNLLGEDEDFEINNNILFRSYTFSEGVFAVQESRYQLENLNFRDYENFRNKIRDFQFCMQEIIESENSKVISQYYTETESKEKDVKKATTVPESSYLGQATNDKANDFFEFLLQYYRSEEKTQVKYVNILYYLKNDANKELYIFKVKQDAYIEIVKSKVGIVISKFQKSDKYDEEEKHILNSLERTFRVQKS